MTVSTILNYPKAEYGNLQGADKKRNFHYLIALTPGPGKYTAYFEKRTVEQLNFQDPKNYGFTPLQIAIAYGKIQWVNALLEKGASLSLQNRFGWTALHIAAFQGGEVLRTLVERVDRATLEVRDCLGSTYRDIQTAVTPPEESKEEIPFQNSEKQIVALSREEFSQKTGAQFLEKAIYSKEKLLQVYQRAYTHQTFLRENKGYNRYLPKGMLAIDGWGRSSDGMAYKNCSCPDGRLPMHQAFFKKSLSELGVAMCEQPNLGYGLVATKDFAKGDFIIPYAGDLVLEGETLDERAVCMYVWRTPTAGLDGALRRGLACLINEGFPNCRMDEVIYSGTGFPGAVPVITATKPIKKGEYLYYDYGAGHNVKVIFPYQYPANWEEAVVPFFRTHRLYDYLDAYVKTKVFPGEEFAYVLGTPLVFLRLVAEGVLQADDIRRSFFEHKELVNFIMSQSPFQLQMPSFALSCFQLREKNPDLLTTLAHLNAEGISTRTILNLVVQFNGCSKTSNAFSKETIGQLKNFAQLAERVFKNYEERSFDIDIQKEELFRTLPQPYQEYLNAAQQSVLASKEEIRQATRLSEKKV